MEADPDSNKPVVQPARYNSGSRNKKKMIAVMIIIAVAAISIATALLWRNDNKDYSAKKSNPVTSAAGHQLPDGQVNISDTAYTPKTIKIKVGQSVTWVNMSNQAHQVREEPYTSATAPNGLDSGEPLANGESYSYTFEKTGIFNYLDYLNPVVDGFKGTVVVEQ
jgi:plastocyanin